jgi:hypothetical protein
MPNKSINNGLLRKFHSGDNNPVSCHYQKHLDKKLLKLGEKGRGIHIGSLMDFNASSGYNAKKRTEGDAPKHQRKPDNVRPYIAPPIHLTENEPHFLFRCGCKRTDAKEVSQN